MTIKRHMCYFWCNHIKDQFIISGGSLVFNGSHALRLESYLWVMII